jgi:hypothetical protein
MQNGTFSNIRSTSSLLAKVKLTLPLTLYTNAKMLFRHLNSPNTRGTPSFLAESELDLELGFFFVCLTPNTAPAAFAGLQLLHQAPNQEV